VLAAAIFDEKAMAAEPFFRTFGALRKEHQPFSNPNERSSFNLLLDFFSREFARNDIKSEADYLLSAFYADEIYRMQTPFGGFDGLLYSSVANDYQGQNFAIKASAYGKKLKYTGAQIFYAYNAKIDQTGRLPKLVLAPVIGSTMDASGALNWYNIAGNKKAAAGAA
jgi:hypothetical protein